MAFAVTFLIVFITVNTRVKDDLVQESSQHMSELYVSDGQIHFKDLNEWIEREHNTVEVNPVFIQIVDVEGNITEKSPNLREEVLPFDKNDATYHFFDAQFNQQWVRQVQVPFYDGYDLVGHLIVAISLEDSLAILGNLRKIMFLTYPVCLILLFFLAKFYAKRSIQPVKEIIQTANTINKENLSTRIKLPENEDELHTLSVTINKLLDRIEKAIQREKQFTSDASHEFRTPIAAVKGTLEVLMRKERNPEHYRDKVAYCIGELDLLHNMMEQLLLIARAENQHLETQVETVPLEEIMMQTIERYKVKIEKYKVKVSFDISEPITVQTDKNLIAIILNNLISNAIKYSPQGGKVDISLAKTHRGVLLSIKDEGIGIDEKSLKFIFDRFYRAEAGREQSVVGSGLGLSIVKKLCDYLSIKIDVKSQPHQGSEFILVFDK
jgi:heavy metal sensor kinase